MRRQAVAENGPDLEFSDASGRHALEVRRELGLFDRHRGLAGQVLLGVEDLLGRGRRLLVHAIDELEPAGAVEGTDERQARQVREREPLSDERRRAVEHLLSAPSPAVALELALGRRLRGPHERAGQGDPVLAREVSDHDQHGVALEDRVLGQAHVLVVLFRQVGEGEMLGLERVSHLVRQHRRDLEIALLSQRRAADVNRVRVLVVKAEDLLVVDLAPGRAFLRSGRRKLERQREGL